jgi:hypothetical protein
MSLHIPERISVTFVPYALSGTISHSHGLRKDRSPFSRRVMDHRGVADRCPFLCCCVIAAGMQGTARRSTTSSQQVSDCCRWITADTGWSAAPISTCTHVSRRIARFDTEGEVIVLAPVSRFFRVVECYVMDLKEAALENFLVESIDDLLVEHGFTFPLHLTVIGTNGAAQIWRYYSGGETSHMLAANRETNRLSDQHPGQRFTRQGAHLLIDREGSLSWLNEVSSAAARLSDS